jgi:hypothetical protein
MKPLLWLLTIALASLGVSACGETIEKTRSAARSSSIVAASVDAQDGSVSGAGRYLNDGDNDPSSDGDTDDLDGSKTDDDKDPHEDAMHPENSNYHDKDDGSIVAYGHPASAADGHAVVVVVKHYYAVAAVGDSVEACSMMTPSLEKAIPEEYGEASGPAYLRGGMTCPEVMLLMFRHASNQLTRAFEVTGVRVQSNHAYALLGSHTIPASAVSLARVGGAWKIEALLGSALP